MRTPPAAALVALCLAACAAQPVAPTPDVAPLALVGGTVIPSPTAAPIPDGVVLLKGGKIAAVGTRAEVAIPAGATTVDCHGATVLAGFWNSHVHFTDPEWASAATQRPEVLRDQLARMLTRWGFVRVVDTGSDLANTLALRKRILSGEVAGPSLLTAGNTYVTPGGNPVYLDFPLPTLRDPAQARAEVNDNFDHGADVLKVMTASVVAKPPAPVMPVPVVRAATDAAHARGKVAYAHPTNIAGVRAAVAGGIDILAHTSPESGPWSEADVAAIRKAGTSLVPTLQLWRWELTRMNLPPALVDSFEREGVAQVRAFSAAGGRVLFGTDVGYMRAEDPTAEYALLAAAGLDFRAVLATLTTAPAEVFGLTKVTGQLAPGMDGDVVVVEGDPTMDVRLLTHVRQAFRAGREVYAAPKG